MIILDKDNSFAFDVDMTLIRPYDAMRDITRADSFILDYYGMDRIFVPIYANIDLLKASVARGRNTIVWSGNGVQHVVKVLKALGLQDLDVTCMSKLIGYCDDVNIQDWVGQRILLSDN